MLTLTSSLSVLRGNFMCLAEMSYPRKRINQCTVKLKVKFLIRNVQYTVVFYDI